MNKVMIAAALLVGASGGRPWATTRPVARIDHKLRPCLNCGDLHDHNNSYCSAECCKEHREAKSA